MSKHEEGDPMKYENKAWAMIIAAYSRAKMACMAVLDLL
jgi:hypothetical protein